MNTLYYGDNLKILRKYIPAESVDLIYLDPPFNSKRAYNVIFKDKTGEYPPSQIKAFDDTWEWCDETGIVMDEMSKSPFTAELYNTLDAFETALGRSDMMAYLVMMAIRLWELKRVLKKTGCIYLHCDPTASHYLKIIMDQIFGVKNSLREIIWSMETSSGYKSQANLWIRGHDTILMYKKSKDYFFNKQYFPLSDSTIRRYDKVDEQGKKYKIYYNKGKEPRKVYLDKSKGRPITDVWKDIISFQTVNKGEEYLGFPTQKPLKLLYRIIEASSNEGDVVLDPFCGCGTAIVASEKLNRKWIGIDITVLAVNLIEKRLREHFPDVKYKLVGVPCDVPSAKKLASTREGKFLFEQWFITTLEGQPFKSKGGGDTGIDGFMHFRDINNKSHRIIVSVKGGGYGPAAVRDLKGVVERENADMGILLALENPSKQSLSEAASAGRYQMPEVERTYPKIQIFTVEDYFNDIRPDLPDTSDTLKKAEREIRESEKPQKLDL